MGYYKDYKKVVDIKWQKRLVKMKGMELEEEEEIVIPLIHVSFPKVIYIMHSEDMTDVPTQGFMGFNTFKQNDSKERWRKIA